MILDHRRILATGIARLRAKIKYHPVVFELMPDTFTLLQLQRCVEALAGRLVHKQNFRRLIEQQELVEETGETSQDTGGRPAKLFRFRRAVFAERAIAGTKLADLGGLTRLILNYQYKVYAHWEYKLWLSTMELSASEHLYAKVRHAIPAIEWPAFADDIDAIMTLKQSRNAVMLAHNYQTPEIFHCVADIVGDSLALAREAMKVEADVIVLAGVHFMAETAKLLNPSKTVLIPDRGAGCSLADSITPEDVRLLRQSYPGVPIVTYVNTSAAVKAESDICCTSGNAKAVIESLGVERVIMLPDEYLAKNIAAETKVKVITWTGHCEVHERFSAEEVRQLRENHPGVVVLAHPECPPDVAGGGRFLRLDRRHVVLCRRPDGRPGSCC